MTRMKQASVRFATALAQRVFPVPGGPKSKTPLGGSIPKLTNFSGYQKKILYHLNNKIIEHIVKHSNI